MDFHSIALNLGMRIEAARSPDDLAMAMTDIAARLGFEYFAVSHHVDLARSRDAIRLHNYPAAWADYYEANALGVSDPVHRASHVTSMGFCWSQIADMILLTANDRSTLALGRAQGIGDGFTIPAHVPGESRGSCSFANSAGRPMPVDMLSVAQLAGGFAFEAARRLSSCASRRLTPGKPAMTDRQRDCVLWAAREKTDWEISRILGVKEDTVARHIKQARERYEVSKRSSLMIRALFDGTLSFGDVLKH